MLNRRLFGVTCALGFGLSLVAAGCGVELFLNQTATFGPGGGDAVAGAPIDSGSRGTIRVLIENNTPFRAIFTYGTFDNTDERSTPVFAQFSPDSQFIPPNTQATLEGFSNSGVVELPCARVFSVGSRSLINLIEKNPGPRAEEIDEAGLVDGVGFSDADLGSDAEATTNQGFARGFETLLGVDFNCGSLLHVTLEFNDAGPDNFVVDMQVFPARDSG